jgi:phosphocarrier protein HPr
MTVFSDPLPEPMPRAVVTASVRLRHEAGLHARPAVKLTQLANRFSAKISFAAQPQGPWINAKSIVKVMAMKTPYDALLHFRAEGEDAEEAVLALVALIERDFLDDG